MKQKRTQEARDIVRQVTESSKFSFSDPAEARRALIEAKTSVVELVRNSQRPPSSQDREFSEEEVELIAAEG